MSGGGQAAEGWAHGDHLPERFLCGECLDPRGIKRLGLFLDMCDDRRCLDLSLPQVYTRTGAIGQSLDRRVVIAATRIVNAHEEEGQCRQVEAGGCHVRLVLVRVDLDEVELDG